MKPLIALSLCAVGWASPVTVGPISLTGSGALTSPDQAPYGGEGFGGIGLIWSAFGSNGMDTVSISTRDIEVTNLTYNPQVGQFIDLSASCTLIVMYPTVPAFNLCDVNIDGITGWNEFSNIGEDSGFLRVFDTWNPTTRVLLAEAQITNTTVQITDVSRNMRGFTANFVVQDPPDAAVPEPATWMIGIPLILLVARSAKSPRRS